MEKNSSVYTKFFLRKRLRLFFAKNRERGDGLHSGGWKKEVHKILKEKRKNPLAFFHLLGYDMLALENYEC